MFSCLLLQNPVLYKNQSLNSQSSMDKIQSKTNQSIYSHSLHKGTHACPTCRCKSMKSFELLQARNIQIHSNPFQNFSKYKNNQRNLYLSNHFSQKCPTEQLSINAYYSNIFKNNLKSNFSPKRTNITFNYISPPKQKALSCDGKFNTKSFKNSRFPQINNKLMDNETVGIVNKKQTRQSPYLEIFTKQNTPEKHKILKNNKTTSKQKLSLTLSRKNSEQKLKSSIGVKSIESNEYEIYLYKQKLNEPSSNQYLLQSAKNTPINQLWAKESRETSIKEINKIEEMKYFNRPIVATSIQHIASKKNINIVYTNVDPPKMVQENFLKMETIQRKDLPSVQSLQIYKSINKKVVEQSYSPQKHNYTYNDYEIATKHEQRLSLANIQQRELARSISDELQLNYDYYYPQEDSDRSLSLYIHL